MRNPTDQGENRSQFFQSETRFFFFFFGLGTPPYPTTTTTPNLPPQVDCLTLFTYPFYQTDIQTDSNLITFTRAADKKEKIRWPAAIGLCRGGPPPPPRVPRAFPHSDWTTWPADLTSWLYNTKRRFYKICLCSIYLYRSPPT